MRINFHAFTGLVRAVLVGREDGLDASEGGNTLMNVYGAMYVQICHDYHNLPSPRTLSMTEIRFFYDGIRKKISDELRSRDG